MVVAFNLSYIYKTIMMCNRTMIFMALVAIFVLHGIIKREGFGNKNAWSYGFRETDPHSKKRLRHPLKDSM